ncbi:MAG: aminopeptidase P N-terminal domain-containing protein [Gammaproteobacteria bacterium]
MLIAKQNREALFAKLLPNSIVILPGNKLKYRSNDVEYPFRQNSNFYYITKFVEPNAVAILIKSNNKDHLNQFILFSQESNLEKEIWTGPIVGQQAALELFEADLAYPINQIDLILPTLLVNKDILYYPMFQDLELETNLYKWRNMSQQIAKSQYEKAFPQEAKDLSAILYELRLIKSQLELEKIRYVAQVSAKAHEHIMKYVASNKNLTERQVQAEFYNYCLQHDCQDMAYQPVVASGENACILHYTKNSAVIKKHDLLLVDAGAEYDYYAADITRVCPANKKFSAKQRDLYQVVLYAQKQAINLVKPGLLWSKLQQTIVYSLVQGLVDLKLLTGNVDELISTNAYRAFYMHGSGHFLGMDVHDPSVYKINDQFRSLSPGMVFTVEPGLYWQGIGIRIEDDILVTEHGHEVLTKSAVKEIEDIEHLMC